VAPTIARATPIGRAAQIAVPLLAALLLLIPASRAEAAQPQSAKASSAAGAGKSSKRAEKRRARRLRAQRRIRRANRGVGLGRNRAVSRRQAADSSTDGGGGVLDAGFENGLFNWNTAGVGEVIPTVASDIVRSGASAGKFVLTGSQHRSELILGGNGNGSANNSVRFDEGSEHWYAFSFYIQSMTYGEPGAHNLIMQFKGTDEGSPFFGLQLWDYEGDDGESGGRGLWSHGDGMDGDRFLSPVAEHRWHDIVVHFKASRGGGGFYEVFLNGELVDSDSGTALIPSGADHAYIKSGLYRNGDEIPGTSEIRLDAVKLGPSLSSVAPS
jgi:Polysaccharide lyase